jgi:hypothetical protein
MARGLGGGCRMNLPACVLLRRNEAGVCRATLGVDLATVGPAPIGEGCRFDVYPNGRFALSPEIGLDVLDALDKLGVAVVEGFAVFHDAACSKPLDFCEKGNGYAL